ncbi:MAG: beta-galactosidase trimerization domain-containing protein, partial [Nitriliruptoraceae bacterium]
ERLRRLEAALDAGAQVVLGPRSLVRDEHAVWVDQAVPAGLAARLGARVEHAGSPSGWPRGTGSPSELVLDDPGNPLPVGGWIETFAEVARDTEVLGRARGGPLDGAPVVVRRGRLTHLGAASEEAWTATLALLLGRRPRPAHLEVFERDRRHVVLDHRARTLGGLGRISDRD